MSVCYTYCALAGPLAVAPHQGGGIKKVKVKRELTEAEQFREQVCLRSLASDAPAMPALARQPPDPMISCRLVTVRCMQCQSWTYL